MKRIYISPYIDRIARQYRDNLFKARSLNFRMPKQLLESLHAQIQINKYKNYITNKRIQIICIGFFLILSFKIHTSCINHSTEVQI